ncbi:MAG: sensor histidine kinase [Pirellulales bacterium]|nr:sensor histidine kinase [Pirellulales bacterium]
MLEPALPIGGGPRSAADQYTELAVLAGGLAHEIKNPLSTIRLNMELLAEDFSDPKTLAERRAVAKVQLVQSECVRLENLLNDFLRFARLGHLDLQPADLNTEVVRALDLFQPQADEAKIDVIRYLDPELPKVLLDREPFQAALLNLILNAQQAMLGGGQLVVRTRELPGLVVLDLIDTGGGIEPEVQQKMFEAFYSTKPAGSGLGLPTTKKIIEAHAGKIAIESEAGLGTKVAVLLPTPARIGGADGRR